MTRRNTLPRLLLQRGKGRECTRGGETGGGHLFVSDASHFFLTLECESKMAFKEGRDAMSVRKPPGAIDGKAVVLAFFAATVYFSFTFSKSSSSNSRGSASSSSSSKSSSGKKTSTLETDDAKARWYVPSNR